MFDERLRSHHDAEHTLDTLLGRPKGHLNRVFNMKPWTAVTKKLSLPPPPPEKSGNTDRGIYIHVPHCDKLCSFCGLNRKERKNTDLDAYAGYIAEEIKAFGAFPYIREAPFNSVYFGGGTPTVFTVGQFALVFDALRRHIPLADDCEITVESTQHNLDAEKARTLAEFGVNRFSIGIQTFSDRGRKILGRTYGGEKAYDELLSLRAALDGTLCIDIIYSYPDQSIEEIEQDAEICVSSGIDSVSFYSLMVNKGSALARSIEAGETRFVRDIESDRERHNIFYNRLTAAGFTLLELSKLVRPGRDAYKYIQIQYGNGDLVPVGSGAGGRLAGFGIYSMSPGRRFVSPLGAEYAIYYRMLGELQFGLYDPARLARFLGPAAEQAIVEKARELSGPGFLVQDGSGWRLTPDGVFWGNNIAVEVLKAAIGAKKGKKTHA
ncbi:MAG: coproporphyrinogen III oxidase family protein [Spirochaetaceae bacterium]|jgi:oxygen-independent coproporphyrinogen-3 oxidase|nr:coproporphyrinogen III oxidase family protein [Spirochaetaceae bacterium]